VIGTSGVGKTRFASELARCLGVRHIELDELFWKPRWTPSEAPEFLARAGNALAEQPRWVCDGNYAAVRDLVWGQATALVWLNLPFPTIFARLWQRCVRRARSGERICGDNRESLARALFHRDSILLWALTSHSRNLREFPAALARFPGLPVLDLRSRDAVARVLTDAASDPAHRDAPPPSPTA
jgi:hypothetical protein